MFSNDATLALAAAAALMILSPLYARLIAAFGPDLVPPEPDMSESPREARIAAAFTLEAWHVEQASYRQGSAFEALTFAAAIALMLAITHHLGLDVERDRRLIVAIGVAIMIPAMGLVALLAKARTARTVDEAGLLALIESRIDLPGSGIWLRTDEASIRREIWRDIRMRLHTQGRRVHLALMLPVIAAGLATLVLAGYGRAFDPILSTDLSAQTAEILRYTVAAAAGAAVLMLGGTFAHRQVSRTARERAAARRAWLGSNALPPARGAQQ